MYTEALHDKYLKEMRDMHNVDEFFWKQLKEDSVKRGLDKERIEQNIEEIKAVTNDGIKRGLFIAKFVMLLIQGGFSDQEISDISGILSPENVHEFRRILTPM